MLGWPKGDPALADAVDVLAVLVVDARKVVLVIFRGAAAESERRAARAGMMRNFMAKGEYEMKSVWKTEDFLDRAGEQRIKLGRGCSRLKLEMMR